MTVTAPEAPVAGRSAALLRLPVLDSERAVFGYELLDLSSGGQGVREALQPRAPLQLADHRLLFLRAGRALLASPVLEQCSPHNLVLQVATVPGDDPGQIAALVPLLQALHARGFRFAFSVGVLRRAYQDWHPLASYVKLDVQALSSAVLVKVLKLLREQTQAVPIACNVDSQERFELLRQLGIPLFQGDWFAKPSPVPAGTIKPSQAVVMQLVNLLRNEADLAEIEPLLKRDPSLSFDLLRVINSAGMGLAVEITSLRHAVLIMGQRRLFRWATVLMTRTRAAWTPPALATAALVRGRLMELLAAELLPQQDCDNAFVTGVFSLVDRLLDMPLAEALAPLALPTPVADALLRRRGLLVPFLALTEACESGDEAAFAAAADELQLSSHQINWAHLQALAWAEELAAAW